jgi:hypothetical protein
MNIILSHLVDRRRRNGSAVLFFIILLAIMVILITANGKALFYLHQETRLLEQRQVKRLNASQTNTINIVESPAKPESK